MQVDYTLGDCGRSWLVGFGEKYPQVGVARRYRRKEGAQNGVPEAGLLC